MSEAPKLWDQSVRVDLESSMRYYARRLEVGLALEGRTDVLMQRVVDEHEIFAMFETFELRMDPAGIRLLSVNGHIDEHAWRALAEALAVLEMRVDGMNVNMHHVVDLHDSDYGASRRVASRALLRHASLEGVEDFAVLIEGHNPAGVAYWAEFGLVSGSELQDRVMRGVGRVPAPSAARLGAARSDPDRAVPEVAFLLDSRWVSPVDMLERSDAPLTFTREVESDADRMCRQLLDRLELGRGREDGGYMEREGGPDEQQ